MILVWGTSNTLQHDLGNCLGPYVAVAVRFCRSRPYTQIVFLDGDLPASFSSGGYLPQVNLKLKGLKVLDLMV